MDKKIVSVELKVFSKNQIDINLKGSIQKELEENSFILVISKNNRVLFKKSYICNEISLLKLKLINEFRDIIETIKFPTAEFKILNDSHKLLKIYSLRCPKCNKKLLESWGKISGIEMKCNRCGEISTPVSDSSPL